jgi:hypothetical protein
MHFQAATDFHGRKLPLRLGKNGSRILPGRMVALSGRALTKIKRCGLDKAGRLAAEVQPAHVRVGSFASF